MSWTLSKTGISPEDIRTELEAAADAAEANYAEAYSDEVQEQIDSAIEAVENLAACVGGDKVTISLSGHANAGHKPDPFYGNDQVTVSISNVDPRPDDGRVDGKGDDKVKGDGTGAAVDEEPGA